MYRALREKETSQGRMARLCSERRLRAVSGSVGSRGKFHSRIRLSISRLRIADCESPRLNRQSTAKARQAAAGAAFVNFVITENAIEVRADSSGESHPMLQERQNVSAEDLVRRSFGQHKLGKCGVAQKPGNPEPRGKASSER